MKKIFLLLLMVLSLFSAQPSFLMPDEAFKPSAKLNDSMQIEAKVWIAKEIYLY
jgi:thiol:disulfide interchange protein DsbD